MQKEASLGHPDLSLIGPVLPASPRWALGSWEQGNLLLLCRAGILPPCETVAAAVCLEGA